MISIKKMLVYIAAFILGSIPAFFIIFNALFTDSSGHLNERLFTFVLTLASYGILSTIFAFLAPLQAKKAAIFLCLPALLILFLYAFKEPSILPLGLVYIALAWIASYFTAYIVHSGRKKNI